MMAPGTHTEAKLGGVGHACARSNLVLPILPSRAVATREREGREQRWRSLKPAAARLDLVGPAPSPVVLHALCLLHLPAGPSPSSVQRFPPSSSGNRRTKVGQFIESVKQEPEDDLGTAPYGGHVVRAPKVLADIVEAIAAAVYVDCKFDLEKLWKVTRWLFEPIITVETIDEQPVTTLHELCQKHGKIAQFKAWQKGGITAVNVFVGGELVGIGSSEQQVIAKLNAARDALGNLTSGAKKQVLTTAVGNGSGDEIGDLRECKQKLNEKCMRKHWPKPFFKIEKEEGPAHERRFVCSVEVETQNGISRKEIQDDISKKEVQNNIFVTIGNPMSRVKDAENSAAQKMLEILLKL